MATTPYSLRSSTSTYGFSELFGGAGDDQLTVAGDDGNRLSDGAGRDLMNGGAGTDHIHTGCQDGALDAIYGFSGANGDQDKLDASGFGAGAVVAFDIASRALTINDEQVAAVFGDFDLSTDILLG